MKQQSPEIITNEHLGCITISKCMLPNENVQFIIKGASFFPFLVLILDCHSST